MNFGYFDFEHLLSSKDYIIEDVKTKGVFHPKRWKETFGKPLTRNIIEAKILHTLEGLTIPLKRYASNQQIQIIEFAGLNGYNEKSKRLKSLLIELLPILRICLIKRIDVCYDFPRVPNSIIKNICSTGRKSTPFKNTIYYKTVKEKKTNQTMDIKRYSKQLKEKLLVPMERLEFVFKGAYLENMELIELENLFSKIEKSIYKFSGIKTKIFPIS